MQFTTRRYFQEIIIGSTVQFDGSIGLSDLIPTAALVFANVRFAEVANGEDEADSIGQFRLLLVAQSTTIGYHFVCLCNN